VRQQVLNHLKDCELGQHARRERDAPYLSEQPNQKGRYFTFHNDQGILGLTSVLSGRSSQIRAESRHHCKIATMRHQDFFDFLARYPTASQNVMRELSLHHTGAFERSRIFGVASTVHSRLAGLLLEWCKRAQQTKGGIQIRFALTHEEIGECIRTSRETVTRILADLRSQGLVRQRGSTLIVPSRGALARNAGIESIPDDSK
jgi:CRP/FNR family cyclic AMP-dependent transcriptional regulator